MINDKPQPGIAAPVDPTSSTVLGNKLVNSFINLMWSSVVYFHTFFESAPADTTVSCTAGTGLATCSDITAGHSGIYLATKTSSPTSGDYAQIDKWVDPSLHINWNASSRMRTGIGTVNNSNQTVYALRGGTDTGSPYYGFKIVDSNLYGVFCDGINAEKKILLQPIVVATNYILEAQYIYANAVKFIVNDNYVGMMSINAISPTKSGSSSPFYMFYVSTQTSANKAVKVSFFEYIQEK